MSATDWVSVKEYTDVPSAEVASGLLTGLGIPNHIHRPPAPKYRGAECYLWVPPERAAEARAVLERSSISDEALTRLALESAPPEDV
jgi:hypothetical protein